MKIGLATDAACRVVNFAATAGAGISARGSVGARLCGGHARMSKHGTSRQRVKLEKRGSCSAKARHQQEGENSVRLGRMHGRADENAATRVAAHLSLFSLLAGTCCTAEGNWRWTFDSICCAVRTEPRCCSGLVGITVCYRRTSSSTPLCI